MHVNPSCWHKTIPVSVILFVAGAAQVYFWLATYGVAHNIDEALQIRAAYSLHAGMGYATPVLGTDVAADYGFSYLTRWAPGYSLLLAVGKALGLEMALSVFLSKVTFLSVAIVAWYFVARQLHMGPIGAALLTLLVPMRLSENPTDLFCGALAPVFVLALLRMTQQAKRYSPAVLVALLSCCIVVLFKLNAVYFVAVGFLYCCVYKKYFSALSMVFPAAVFVGTVVWLRSLDDVFGWSDFAQKQAARGSFNAQRLWDSSIDTQLTQIFDIQQGVIYLAKIIQTVAHVPVSLSRSALVLTLSTMLVVVVWRYCIRTQRDDPTRRLAVLALLFCVCSGLVLSVASALLGSLGFTLQYRYYSAFAPLIIFLVFVVGIEYWRETNVISKAIGLTMLVLSLLGPGGYFVQSAIAKYSTQPVGLRNGASVLLSKVHELAQGEPLRLIVPLEVFATIDEPAMIGLSRRPKSLMTGRTVSRPVWVFIAFDQNAKQAHRYVESLAYLSEELELQSFQHDNWWLYYVRLPSDKPTAN